MVDPCMRIFNNLYDTCIYVENKKLIERKFNCSFNLLLNNSEKAISEKLDACKISDIARAKPVNTFHNMLSKINQGKIFNLKKTVH